MPKIRLNSGWIAALAVFFLNVLQPALAVELTAETVQAWDKYLQWAEQKTRNILSDPNKFLIQNTLPPREKLAVQKQLESGAIIARRMDGVIPREVHFEVPSGEIHHWWGSILLRNVSLTALLKFLQDYDHHAGKFSDVERSKLWSVEGDHYRFLFRLKRSKSFVTAHYNTMQECTYTWVGSNRAYSQSTATRIAEVENPGTASESERPPGNDRGFMWRLVSWWRFEQRDKDVLVEIESASLSRDIPAIVRFMPGISGYIRSVARESMESVLISIREQMGRQRAAAF
jgi:hypothetical protein